MQSADLITLLPGTPVHIADRDYALIGAPFLSGALTTAVVSRRAYLRFLHTDIFEPDGPALAYQIAGPPTLTQQGRAFAALMAAAPVTASPLPALRDLCRRQGARLHLDGIHPDRMVFGLPRALVTLTSAGQVHVTSR